jgi:uncharacterized protein YecE (DUF72 family)
MAGRVRIGTQGWNYAAWVGPFYPEGTRPADMLPLYARAFDTVEVDSTFYATPPPNTVRGWASRAPDGFVFALKLPQEITHERHLRRAEAETDTFIERARILGPKLGPILVQLGPEFTPPDFPALAAFVPASRATCASPWRCGTRGGRVATSFPTSSAYCGSTESPWRSATGSGSRAR